MYEAYISIGGKKLKVSIDEYIRGYEVNYINAYCFTCDQILTTKAKSSINTRIHFAHTRLECPTKENHRVYQNSLDFRDYRIGQKQEVTSKLKVNLSKVYNQCLKLCDGALFPSEFSKLLKQGSKKRMWEYVDIQLHHLPFSLLTLPIKFNKLKNNRRRRSIFFVFKEAQIIERHFWINYTEAICLQKYDVKNTELIQEIDINDNFLTKDFHDLGKFEIWRKKYNLDKMIF